MKDQIKYRSGYKYQLAEEYTIETGIIGGLAQTEFLLLSEDGLLTIKSGYAWDGPSGPTVDTSDFMRGSLVHDALYQLMRQGYLSLDAREDVDRLLQVICLEDGMSSFRAHYVFEGVSFFGEEFVKNEKEIFTAPGGKDD